MMKRFLGVAIVFAVAAFATPALADRSRDRVSADESPAYNPSSSKAVAGPALLAEL